MQPKTRFQEYYLKNRDKLLTDSFKKFQELYPELSEKKARKEYEKQVTEMFFHQLD